MIVLILAAQLALASPRIYDADTLYVGQLGYRLAMVDAPEIGKRAACAQERRLGIAARDRVRVLVSRAARVEALPAENNRGERWRDDEGWPRDRFRRRLVTIRIDGEDLGELLLREGRAQPWTYRAFDWCAPGVRR